MSAGSAARPRVLSIAGSDSGGGAGIQADLKTFAAHGAYGMTAVTAVTAQNTVGVRAVHEVPPELVAAQIAAVFDDLGVDAVKIGMLGSAAIVGAVARELARWPGVPVVLDPVMVAKSGDPLLAPEAVAALVAELLPLARLVTPNVPEAEALASALGLVAAAGEAGRRLGEALSARGTAVLVKGGHGEGAEIVDALYDGGERRDFVHARQPGRATHGTGCALSAAIAARLAAGERLSPAVEGAIAYLQGALRAATPLGAGHGPVDHLWELAPLSAADR